MPVSNELIYDSQGDAHMVRMWRGHVEKKTIDAGGLAVASPEINPRVNLRNFRAGFVFWERTHRDGRDRFEGILLGSPYKLGRSGPTYYCKVLLPGKVIEERLMRLFYLQSPSQSLKSQLKKGLSSLEVEDQELITPQVEALLK